MQRARRTAELAGFEPRITDLLKEADYGQYEGLTSRQIHESDPDWEIYEDGSPGGETPAQIYARANRFIQLATQREGEGEGEGEGPISRILAFGHGHFLRAVAVAWIQADLPIAARLQLDVATVSVLREADRGRVIAVWNES